MKEKIKELYQRADNKHEVISAISKQTGRTYNTIKNHWLSNAGGWSVPKRFEELVLGVLQS